MFLFLGVGGGLDCGSPGLALAALLTSNYLALSHSIHATARVALIHGATRGRSRLPRVAGVVDRGAFGSELHEKLISWSISCPGSHFLAR